MNYAQTLNFLLHAPIDQAILIKGAHGIGKSDVVRQAAKEMGGTLVDLRLSQNDVGDLKGMPFLVNGRTYFAPPNWFPMDEKSKVTLSGLIKGSGQVLHEGIFGEKGILFLDELNRATRECEQVAFELVLDRRLNFIDLPPGWRVVAAINDDTDIYNANEMDPALLSRFAEVPFIPTVDEWLKYAKENDVHPAVVQFITKQENALDCTKDMLKNPENRGKKMHDRRSWTKLSKNIKEFEKKNPKWLSEEADYRMFIFQSYLGTIMATKFNTFVMNDYVVLNASKILNDWDKSVETHLKKAKVVELGGYNKLIVDYMKSDKDITGKSELNRNQAANLLRYVESTPNEVGADFWTIFNQELNKVSDHWYNKTPGAQKVILSRLASPEAIKRRGMQ